MKTCFFSRFSKGLVLSISILCLISCNHTDDVTPTGQVQFQFTHVVGSLPLALNATQYTNAAGESFYVKTFKYYVSNIKFIRADGSEYAQPESYYLVNEGDSASKTFTIPNVPIGTYTGVNFMIGVDSTRNVSGAQTGALDALNDMFWSWKTGYIFVKMEGTSPSSTASGNRIEYHIGGFQNPNNIRTATFSLGNNKLYIKSDSTSSIHFQTDVGQLFQTPNLIKFAETPALMTEPKTADIADNYSDMFSIVSIQTGNP
ncbi:hypothetical protein QNI16_10805 [Cytophagaceae bacterium YF14B1]|uniref:Copper-binding protein MbnP-like domain-containing protein n=1 Tax=Xanthocytophaga flava TaxID=3048013 RepID=A0AAE3QKD0_9BACT|nr:hypothetical protein [Xanthocytophaga flavus]